MTPYERDLLTRTVLGEAGGEPPEGQQAVAAVVLNRLNSGKFGKTLPDVILQPNAFEAWSKPSAAMAFGPDRPEYTRAAAAVDAAANGEDPTGGAVNFLNPDLQFQLGRKQPKWAPPDQGQRIGRHVFYGGTQVASNNDDAFSSVFGDAASAKASSSDDAFAAVFGGAPKDPAERIASNLPAPKPERTWGDTFKDLGAGALRGVVDVGDTVSERALGALATGASVASHVGLVKPETAARLQKQADDYTAMDRAQRTQFEKDHPPSDPIWGFIPSDPASIGRLVGQGVAVAPAVMATGPVGLTGNVLADAALTGAVVGGESGALTSSGYDEPMAQQIAMGALAGGVVGGAARGVGQAAKAAANKLVGAAQRVAEPALDHIADLFRRIGLTPEQAERARLDLGPGATYADIDPALRSRAGALAARGGETTSLLKNRYQTRNEASGNQTSQGIDRILGPKPDLTKLEEGIETNAQNAAGPFYKKAYKSGQAFDVKPIIQGVDDALDRSASGGRSAAALTKARKYLHDAQGEPIIDLERLHIARQELDADIRKAAAKPGSEQIVGRLDKVRKAIDAPLKSNSDMAAGDKAYSEAKRLQEFLDAGRNVFKNDTRPEDLQRLVQGATPEQLDALRQGTRIAIGDAVGSTTRGELTDAQMLFGKKTPNRDKLRIVHPQQADDVLDMVHANQATRLTENDVLRPSKTAEYTAAQDEYKPAPVGDSTKDILYAGLAGMASGDPFVGATVGGLHKAAGLIGRKLKAQHFDNLAKDTAHVLSASGPEAEALAEQLARRVRRAPARKAANKLINFGAAMAPHPLEITVDKYNTQSP